MVTHPLNPRTDDKRLKRSGRFWINRSTAYLRALPDFLIIGEMKSGTSSLFHYLCRHPMVQAPIRKELHFFSIGHHKGPGWYRSHFPLKHRLSKGALTGEGCPDYLFAPGAREKIRRLLPDVRMVVLLRNPVERAISHYYHEVKMGRENLPILEALKVEEARLAESNIEDEQGLETYLHASYKARGCYADQLEPYFADFDRQQLLIMGNNHLLTDPRGVTNKVFQFLGLPELGEGLDYPRKNSGDKQPVPDEVRSYLADYFEPHNRRLFAMLGETVNW